MDDVIQVILQWLIVLRLSMSLSAIGYPVSTNLSLPLGLADNPTLRCQNNSHVLQIDSVFDNCTQNGNFEAQTSLLIVLIDCDGHQSCNLSDTGIEGFLAVACQMETVSLLINATCLLAADLDRMCTAFETAPITSPYSLYGPATSNSDAWEKCTCSINATDILNIEATILLDKDVILTITSEDTKESWSRRNEIKHQIKFDNTTEVQITLSRTNNAVVGRINLLIESTGSMVIKCFSDPDRNYTTSTTTTAKSTSLSTISERDMLTDVTDTSATSRFIEKISHTSTTTELETTFLGQENSSGGFDPVYTSKVALVETSYEIHTTDTYSDGVSYSSTPEDHTSGSPRSQSKDRGEIINKTTIIIIAVAVTLILIIVVVVTVCKRRNMRSNNSEMVKQQYPGSTTSDSSPKGIMLNDAFLPTENGTHEENIKIPLQNSNPKKTDFQKPGENTTSSLNELYGSTESGIAISTDPNPGGSLVGKTHTINKVENLYDQALPVSHDPNVYKPSVFPGDSEKSSDPPYYLYDDSHKDPKTDQTGSKSGSSGDSTFCPEILDYAPSYHKTKGDDIKTLKPLAKQTPMNIANGSAQSLQAYSYADSRGPFIEGITPHIVGQGYDVEKPVPDDKCEQFQSSVDTNKVNMTGSKTNLGPYSYAACSVNPDPMGDLKPPQDASLAHYESMNAIYKPNETDKKESEKVKYDNIPNPPAEYEGVAFPGKGKTPVVVDGVEMVENDVYSKE